MSQEATYVEFREQLYRENQTRPFYFSEKAIRDNLIRVEKIATKCGLTAVRFRGFLEISASCSGDHLWVDIEGSPVDVTFPVLNPEFRSVFGSYVATDADQADVNAVIKRTDFSERLVLPDTPPEGVRYSGQPVFMAK